MSRGQIRYGDSSFRTMIENNYRYIDKTEAIYRMISTLGKVFLSRPRRFGKSLLVDTLKEIFSGNKELFKDLAIYKKDYDWKKYPVIFLSLASLSSSNPEDLQRALIQKIKSEASSLKCKDISWDNSVTARDYFWTLIDYFKQKSQEVVVLIDEYDYPLISNLDLSSSDRNKILNLFTEFYSVLKDCSNEIHFLFLTGVTRIAKTTIFSGLNNLKDISFKDDFCDILGYRQEDVESYFSNEIDSGATKLNLDRNSFLSKVKEWYDGYRFSNSDISVYNPSDINQFFQDNCSFISYWTNTGTPSFLVKLLSNVLKLDLKKELSYPRSLEFFTSNLDLEKLTNKDNLVLLLYQSGYITIKENVEETNQYLLSFPNREVELAFNSYIVEVIWGEGYNFISKYIQVALWLIRGNTDKFISGISDLFKAFTPTPQKYYENAVHLPIVLLFKMLGSKIEEQVHAGEGISDIVVETKDTVYIIELKMDEKAETAIKQIEDKRYMDKYLLDPKYSSFKVVGIGLSFSSSNCQLIDSKIKEF